MDTVADIRIGILYPGNRHCRRISKWGVCSCRRLGACRAVPWDCIELFRICIFSDIAQVPGIDSPWSRVSRKLSGFPAIPYWNSLIRDCDLHRSDSRLRVARSMQGRRGTRRLRTNGPHHDRDRYHEYRWRSIRQSISILIDDDQSARSRSSEIQKVTTSQRAEVGGLSGT